MSVKAIETKEEYIQRLSTHDWDYSYSDEHAVWMKGAYEWRALKEAAETFDPDYTIWNTWAIRPEYKLKKELV